MQILGGAQMDEQSRVERPSYGWLCRTRWPRVVSWDHLLRHHFSSSSVPPLVLCLNEIPPKFDSSITCHIHFMGILLMHSSLLKRQQSSIRGLRTSLLWSGQLDQQLNWGSLTLPMLTNTCLCIQISGTFWEYTLEMGLTTSFTSRLHCLSVIAWCLRSSLLSQMR